MSKRINRVYERVIDGYVGGEPVHTLRLRTSGNRKTLEAYCKVCRDHGRDVFISTMEPEKAIAQHKRKMADSQAVAKQRRAAADEL